MNYGPMKMRQGYARHEVYWMTGDGKVMYSIGAFYAPLRIEYDRIQAKGLPVVMVSGGHISESSNCTRGIPHLLILRGRERYHQRPRRPQY